MKRWLLTFTLTTPIPPLQSQRELRLDPKPPGDYSNSLSYRSKAVRVLHIYQGMLSNPHQLKTQLINALLLIIVIYLQCTFRFIVISQQVLKDGLLSLDSQTAMARIGCVTMVDSGLTNKLPMEQQMTHQWTLIWYHLPFGWSEEANLRSRAVTTPVTPLCYRPQVTVWLDKHSDLKSQVMATLEMARSGPVIDVWEIVRFNMAEIITQQKGLNRLIAMETSKALTRSASGVTGSLGMGQSWWLVEEEVNVHVQITELESQKPKLLLSLKRIAYKLNMTLVIMLKREALHPCPTRWTYGSVKSYKNYTLKITT